MEMPGPAWLAHLDPAEFHPHHGPYVIEQILSHDADLGQLVAASSAEDIEESSITQITSRPSPPANTERSSPPPVVAR